MKNNYTKINRKIDLGKQKNLQKKMIRNKNSSRLTTNYSLMLQLYLIQKEEAANKSEVKYLKQARVKKPGLITKASLWIAGIVPFTTRIFDYFHRETKTSVSI